MRPVLAIARLLLFGALLFWISDYRPWALLASFSPIPQIIFGLALPLMMFGHPITKRLSAILSTMDERRFLASAMILFFAISLSANKFVLDGVPHVSDSSVYLFMAKTLLGGSLFQPLPELPEFFRIHFVYLDGERMIPLFQFGWPLVLAVGEALGDPGLVNPLLGALSLIPLYRIGKRILAPLTARYGVLLILISPFSIYMSASYMAHTLSAFLCLVVLDQAIYMMEDGRKNRAALIGLALGFLFLVRAFNAILLLFPLGLLVIPALVRKRMAVHNLLLILILALPISSFQLGINHFATGDCLRFPQDEYFSLTEASPRCHRLGLGEDIGCFNEHGIFSFPKGYYLSDALGVTKQRIASLSTNFLGLPLILLFSFIPLAAGPFRRGHFLLYSLPMALAIGYMFFYYHGNCYGPRFYYEGAGFLALLLAEGFVRGQSWFELISAKLPQTANFWKALVPSVLICCLIFLFGWVHPKLYKTYGFFRGIDASIARYVEDQEIENAVILLPGTDVNYAFGFNLMNVDLDDDIIYARHWFDQSLQLMWLYPEREFYRYLPNHLRFVKLKRKTFEGIIPIEMESKIPVRSVFGGWVDDMDIERYRPGKLHAGMLYLSARRVGAGFTVWQYIFEPGDYFIEAEALRGPFMGDWRLTINGKDASPEFSGWAKEYAFTGWRSDFPIRLEKGHAVFEFTVSGRDESAFGQDIGIDTLILRRAPDGLRKELPTLQDLGYLEEGKLMPIGQDGIPRKRKKDRKTKD